MNAWQETSGGIAFPKPTPAVKWLLIAFAGVFVAYWLIGLGSIEAAKEIDRWLGLNHGMWFAAPIWFPLWQLLTVAFIHGDIGHLFYNCLVLYFFGTMLEGIVGTQRFAWFFGAAVLVASVTSLVFMQIVDPHAITVGASGGILAALVAAATFRPHATVILIFIPVPMWLLAVGLVALDVFPAIESLVRGGGGIDHFAHLGGAAFGFLAVRKGFIWTDYGARFSRIVEERRQNSAADDEAELDRLLARVGREGIASLSGRERAFLKRMSERKSGRA